MQKVFVYGTLRAGEINDISEAAARHDIAEPTLIGTATVRGRLFDFGALCSTRRGLRFVAMFMKSTRIWSPCSMKSRRSILASRGCSWPVR
jgi:gamma-glutamylcyclotransferase (GGCT)/AIG2-like uncharacterized protein YtfP